jgi:hypothetical protein
MVAISIITTVTAVLVGRKVCRSMGHLVRPLTAIAGYLLVTITAIALLPSYSEVPADFSATVLFEFRMASLATQLAVWATIGVTLGKLPHRMQRRTDLQAFEPDYAEPSL